MLVRHAVAPFAALLMLVMSAEVNAAKPIQSTIMPLTLYNITADGEVDLVTPGPPAVALVEIYYKRGDVVVEIESQGEVENLSGRRFRSTNPEDIGDILLIPGDFEITDFEYTVSRSGKAVLKMRGTGFFFIAPPGI